MNDWKSDIAKHSTLKESVREALTASIDLLLREDDDLLQSKACERAITHRLALHLTPLVPDWQVDCEYNIDGADYKRLQHGLSTGEEMQDPKKGSLVYPDIIVHMRGESGQAANLLVIEVKKYGASKADVDLDRRKLEHYRSNTKLRYQHALFLWIGTGKRYGQVRVRWFDP